LEILFGTLQDSIHPRRELVLENLLLRQQLAVLKCRYSRTRLKDSDRIFRIFLSRVWSRKLLYIWSNQQPSFVGIGRDLSILGVGRVGIEVDLRLIPNFVT